MEERLNSLIMTYVEMSEVFVEENSRLSLSKVFFTLKLPTNGLQ